jgi:multimeric flavodoxin WrbA
LIINGSPRANGNTARLVGELKSHLSGEIVEISAYWSKIAPCVDCRRCWALRRCAVEDDMEAIYKDDFDNAVLATPVHYATLPGPVLSLLSRFQPQHPAMFVHHDPILIRPKKAGLILVAGGKGGEAGAQRQAHVLFKMLNASGYEGRVVISGKTDTVPAGQDAVALGQARELAKWLMEGHD